MSRKPDEPVAGESREDFASRWSRLKQEARESPAQPPAREVDPKSPAPELSPIEKLTIDSDYRAFFHPKVGEDVRRAALKKLFSDPRFNVMDGLDVYIDDYSKSEPIPAAMLAGLKQAQNILGWAKEDEEQRAKEKRAREQQLPEDAPPQAIEPPAEDPALPAGAPPAAPDAAPALPGDPVAPVKR
jgi:hypothetical protein